MNTDDVQALWLYCHELWPTFEIPEIPARLSVKLTVWFDVLADLDAGSARAAIADLESREFPPTPKMIWTRAMELSEQERGDAAPSPDEAWREVAEGIRSVGRYSVPAWSHPCVAEAVRVMGWTVLCDSEEPDWTRKDFVGVYGRLVERTTKDRRPELPVVARHLAELSTGRPALDGPARLADLLPPVTGD